VLKRASGLYSAYFLVAMVPNKITTNS